MQLYPGNVDLLKAGGTIENDWDLPKALEIGDKATGTRVLTSQYTAWKDEAVTVDLEKLEGELGVRATADAVEFVRDAPLSAIREAMTARSLAQATAAR